MHVNVIDRISWVTVFRGDLVVARAKGKKKKSRVRRQEYGSGRLGMGVGVGGREKTSPPTPSLEHTQVQQQLQQQQQQRQNILQKSQEQAGQKSQEQAGQKSQEQAGQKSQEQAGQKSQEQAGQKSQEQARQKSQEQEGQQPSALDYMHFGRLMGDSISTSEKVLSSKSLKIEEDERAKLYMTKWQRDEEVSYAMFEKKLQGSTHLSTGREMDAATLDDVTFDQIVGDGERQDVVEALLQMEDSSLVEPLLNDRDEKVWAEEHESALNMENEEAVQSPNYDDFASMIDGDDMVKKTPKQKGKKKELTPVQLKSKVLLLQDLTKEKVDTRIRKERTRDGDGDMLKEMPSPVVSEQSKETGELARLVQLQAKPSNNTQKQETPKHGQRNFKNRMEDNLQRAMQFGENEVEARVWQVNSSGALVDAQGVTGFVPFALLSPHHAAMVIEAQRKVLSSAQERVLDRNVRQMGMGVLLEQILQVHVVHLDPERGRVIFSEQRESRLNKAMRKTVEMKSPILQAAAQSIGSVVDARIRNVKEFGVFVDFELPRQVDGVYPICLGLVHQSECTWDDTEDMDTFITGTVVPAKIIHIDSAKKRIFLSFKRTKPNPLLQTLDSLLSNKKEITKESIRDESRSTFDSSADMRPLLGDLDDAVALATRLRHHSDTIHNVTLGSRLQSKGSSQLVEVYLSKHQETQNQNEIIYTLVVRKGFDVQEVKIRGSISRQQLIQMVAEETRTDS